MILCLLLSVSILDGNNPINTQFQSRNGGKIMCYLNELIKQNGHKLVKYDKCIDGHKYESVFNYSSRYGGTFDGFKYYNNYVIDVTK